MIESLAMTRKNGFLRAGGRLLGLCLALMATGLAERLPIKTYTIADGLARDGINRIVRDSRGYLWFCTSEGLSRFDGYQFTTYTIADGLPHSSVRDILETRDGQYWIATGDGLCRLNLIADSAARAPFRKFEIYRPDPAFKKAHNVLRLLEDHAGVLWCGTADGLFRLRANSGGWMFEPAPLIAPADGPIEVRVLLEDHRGNFWIGSRKGLFRRRTDGQLERYTAQHGLPPLDELTALLEDRYGRIWLATRWHGLHRLVSDATTDRPIVADRFFIDTGIYSGSFLSLFESSDGRLWAGRYYELAEIIQPNPSDPVRFRRFTAANGLEGIQVWALNEDRDGNLWMGSETSGALKIARHGFTLYDQADGLTSGGVNFGSNREGTLYVRSTVTRAFVQWDGTRFVPFHRKLKGQDFPWWGFTTALTDHTGDWWFPTKDGLTYFPKRRTGQLASTPAEVYTTRDGLDSDFIFGLYEDTHRDLWIAQNSWSPGGLTRWERTNGTFHRYSRAEDIPFLNDNFISSMGEDAAGQVWLGLWYGGLVRHRAGRFTWFTAADGVPAGNISAIHCDAAGRLWVASASGGVARVDDPTAARPHFVLYNRTNGLASDLVSSITEDRAGRLYFGTGRGINRLDPATNRIKHYTTADGLPENSIGDAYRDRDGRLWFSTRKGLVRLDSELDRPAEPPILLISGLRIAGAPWPVSELGQAEVKGVEVPPGQSPIQVDFFGLSFAPGERLRYQHRFEGDRLDWSEPSETRTLHLTLVPGAYRLQVRAVSNDGLTNSLPAVVALTVLHPVWQRGWFLALSALAVGLVGYTGYRYRVAQIIALEHVRTRIATDLHDDIGSNLSRMAILSEVVKQQTSDRSPESAPLLADIADSARQLVEAMSDIVWAIDPRQDDAGHLTMRLRQFAADMFDLRSIRWEVQAPPELEHRKLRPEQRRQVFLIGKEAIHNIVKHAGATDVAIAISETDRELRLEIQDDGRGFTVTETPAATPAKRRGHGLASMKARAAQLGGELTIESKPSHGTRLRLRLPL